MLDPWGDVREDWRLGMLANAIEILMAQAKGFETSWTLEDFRYRSEFESDDNDDDIDPLAAGAMSADQQEALIRQIAARFGGSHG